MGKKKSDYKVYCISITDTKLQKVFEKMKDNPSINFSAAIQVKLVSAFREEIKNVR